MLSVLYEDKDIIVVEKPAGLESQSSRGFGADMVSEIRSHLASAACPQNIHKMGTSKPGRLGISAPPYVGVIHRLDRPVRGVMVYAKTKKAAALLSRQVQEGRMKREKGRHFMPRA